MSSPLKKKQKTMSSSSEEEHDFQEQALSVDDMDLACHEEDMQKELLLQQHHDEEHALSVAHMDLGCYEEDMQKELLLQQHPDEAHAFQEQALAVANMDFGCYEEDMQKELSLQPHHDEEVENVEQLEARQDYVLGDDEAHDFIKMLLSKQFQPIPITAIEANTRASTIDTMLASEKARQYPNAIPLAVLVFDRYFGTFPPDQGQAALNPQTVITVALFIAVKYEYGIDKPLRLTFDIRNVDMECRILSSFDYRLFTPTTKSFVDLQLSFTEPHDPTVS